MEEKEIEYLIDKKIAESKLEVSEKRNQFLLWFFGVLLTVFGVLIPFWWSNRSSDKVDEAISGMKREVKEIQAQYEQKSIDNERTFKETVKEINSQQNSSLATISNNADKTIKETKEQVQELIGKQLAKPEIALLYSGKEVNDKTIDITGLENWANKFEIINKGKAAAKNLKLIIYLKQDSKLKNIPWAKREVCEEKGFENSYLYSKKIEMIFPNDSYPLETNFSFGDITPPVKEEVLLRIFFDEVAIPLRIGFLLEIKNKK